VSPHTIPHLTALCAVCCGYAPSPPPRFFCRTSCALAWPSRATAWRG
jgi:hypothetical protein